MPKIKKPLPEQQLLTVQARVESLGDGAVKMPRQELAVQLASETLNSENRTIDAQFYSGAQVQRMNWWTGEKWMLQFSMDPAHVRLGRMNSGAPVLNAHDDRSLGAVLGVVERAWLEGGKGKATLRFSDRADVEPLWADIKNRIIRNVSMGAAIHKMKDVTPEDSKVKHWLATDWEPMELSAVPIGADAGAGFLSAENEQFTECSIEQSESRANTAHEKENHITSNLTTRAPGLLRSPSSI